MKVKPLYDRLVVKRLEEEEKTKVVSSFPMRQGKAAEGVSLPWGTERSSKTARKHPYR